MSENSSSSIRGSLSEARAAARKLPGAAFTLAAFRILRAGVRDVLRGELQVRAASLVYSTLLALVPLIAVSFSVLKGFGVQNQMRGFIGNLFSSVGDDQEAIVDQIVGFVDNMEVGVLGGVGLAILFYTVFSLIRKIEAAMNFCWRTYRSRSFGEGFTRYISIIILGPVLLFAALTMSASITSEPLYQQVSRIPGLAELIDWGGQLLPYGMLVLAFTSIYYFLPNTYVRFRAALAGGVIAAFLWFLFGLFFAQIVAGSGNYVAIYATFATMIIFMIWMFIAWLVLLFGASIAFYAQNPAFSSLSIDQDESQISGRARERVALAVMKDIARQYAHGATPPSLATLSERLEMPIQSINWVIDIMLQRRLLTSTIASPPTYVPGRSAEAIMVRDILEAVRLAGHNADQSTHKRRDDDVVEQVMTKLDRSRSRTLGTMTLQDLAANSTGAAKAEAAPPPTPSPTPSHPAQNDS